MSTKMTETADKDETAQEFKRCECGCGAIVNPKSHFQPGHDAKLKSKLLAHWDAGQGAMAEELVDRGWYSWDELYERRDKREAREQAKADRAEKAAKAKIAQPRRARANAKAA